MYVNKCIKCGREFETKNPKRVICPDCLYPDKSMMINSTATDGENKQQEETQQPLQSYSTPEAPRFYSAGGTSQRPQQRPQRSSYNAGGYNRDARQQGNRSNYGSRNPYNRDRRNNSYGGQKAQGGRDNRFNRRTQNNKFRRPSSKPKAPKQLLVTKEQLDQIELLYKAMLPLPNPDAHEVIGEKIGLEPRKVFFGINLIRQKLMLPKLPFPKRKLAISPDQLFAIKNLYEPLLPLPPIGCHKIIAAQLKMDEWRVHVGIGLIRAQMGLKRWNQDRPDAPEEYRKPPKKVKPQQEETVENVQEKTDAAPEQETNVSEDIKEVVEETPKSEETAVAEEKPAEETKPKRGRKSKKAEETAEA